MTNDKWKMINVPARIPGLATLARPLYVVLRAYFPLLLLFSLVCCRAAGRRFRLPLSFIRRKEKGRFFSFRRISLLLWLISPRMRDRSAQGCSNTAGEQRSASGFFS